MAYTAQQLITNSWFLSGIVARNLQYPTGDQITDGLQMLNDLLNFKQIETDLIPFYQYITFLAVPGQEFYFLPYVAEIETSTFNINVVRYPMVNTGRRNYFGSSRVDNIETLPFSWNYERGVGGGTLGMYFIPDQPYPIKMKAKIALTDVSLNTDLTYILPPSGATSTFSSTQATSSFTAAIGHAGALVITTAQSMSFGEEVQFTGGSIPSTLSLLTTYYAVPVNEGSFNVASSLANAQSGIYIAYASGTGNVTSFSLVITFPYPVEMFVGDQIIFDVPPNLVPPPQLPGGVTTDVIYYANPSSPTTLTLATTLANAQSGTNIPYSSPSIGNNSLTFINPNNIPGFTYYRFINNANQGYDTSYIEMLRYALARYMCSEYGIMFNPQSEKIYQSYVRKLMYMDPPDMSMKKLSILRASDSPGYNWGDVNIGHGWRG